MTYLSELSEMYLESLEELDSSDRAASHLEELMEGSPVFTNSDLFFEAMIMMPALVEFPNRGTKRLETASPQNIRTMMEYLVLEQDRELQEVCWSIESTLGWISEIVSVNGDLERLNKKYGWNITRYDPEWFEAPELYALREAVLEYNSEKSR